jgi:competence protein ComEC
VPVVWAPLVAVALLAWPIPAYRRPDRRLLWIAVGLSALASVRLGEAGPACAPGVPGEPASLQGRFVGAPAGGSGAFRPDACPEVTAVVPDSGVPAGRAVRLTGSWRQGTARAWFLATEVELLAGDPGDAEWRWWTARWRDDLVRRFQRLYAEQAPLVSALTLARTEGFDPELREAFSRVGIAHLLAISGFHVAVIAGVVLALLRAAGLRSRPSEIGAAAAAWAYVGLIGFPDPAVRAAIMLALVALSRARGRPVARWGPLAAAWLLLLVTDPRRMASVGFQLSFAGVAGLVAWAGPLTSQIRRLGGRRVPKSLATAVAAGLAATAATLPIVAWHFERVSLVGIPVTIVATPIVSLALTGSLASLALDFVSHGLASFLAGGVSVLLTCLEVGTDAAARWPWASVWTTRSSVAAGTLGLAAAAHLARRPRIGARARRLMTAVYVTSGVLAWPVLLAWQGRGTAELLVIDVGQGDAIALRSPRGRWLLVDAGPAARGSDPAAHPAVRALRARGVRRLEALVLTHPDFDHIGGAAPVLAAFEVGAVYDPALPAPKPEFVSVLDAAAARGVPWRAARAGGRIELDGVLLEVLHPPDSLAVDVETNATSVVLRLSFGAFDALLTGDAYKDVERDIASGLGPIEVLKVGHHGSDTSTDSLMLERTRPELALISVGRSNRYGHPAPAVLGRLERSGAHVLRTDREGTLSVLAREDGTYSVTGERAGRGGGG